MSSGWVTWASAESWGGALGPNRVGLLSRGNPTPHPSRGDAVCTAWQPPTLLVSSAPTTLPSLLSVSDVPEGAENFGVSGSSGVKIFMVYDPARVMEPTGRAHWPLDASVDVVVSVDAASKALNDLKVRGSLPRRRSEPPTTHAPLTHR